MNIRTLAWSTAILILFFFMAACSGGGANGTDGASPSVPATASPAPTTETPGAKETGGQDMRTGTYNGLIDGHTVEIETEHGAQAFQISPELAQQVSDWEPGTRVKYRFEENTITFMEKA